MQTKNTYSKASSCTDPDNAHFRIDKKKLRCINLCSENLVLHGFLMPLPYQVTQVARIVSCTSFSVPPKTCISRPYCMYAFKKVLPIILDALKLDMF